MHQPKRVNFRQGKTLKLLSCFILLGCASLPVHALDIRIAASRIQYREFSATGIRAGLSADGAMLKAREITTGSGPGMTVHDFNLVCGSFGSIGEGLCAGASWSRRPSVPSTCS